MTWEEAIRFIRTKPQYAELVEKAYFEEDLRLNVQRFRHSEEYAETIRLLNEMAPNAKTLLDIGSGNGISAVSFALDGYFVSACEPDPSETVGAGAIKRLKEHFNITDLEVYEEYAERLNIAEKKFDVIYARQVMHHANNLSLFVKNLSGMLKPGGVLFTARDHVIYNEADKQLFLDNHPLQSLYGGENAFREEEYLNALQEAGLAVLSVFKHFDSVINYFPLTKDGYKAIVSQRESALKDSLRKKIGLIGELPIVFELYKKKVDFSETNIFRSMDFPGRMYSFIAQKL